MGRMSWFLLLFVLATACSEDPCNFYMSVNIDEGNKLEDGSIITNGLMYPPNLYFEYEGKDGVVQTRGCICELKACYRKCCPLGEILVNASKCVPSGDAAVLNFTPRIYSLKDELPDLSVLEHFGLLTGNPCFDKQGNLGEGNRYSLNPFNPDTPNDRFYLQKNGSLYIPDVSDDQTGTFTSQMGYCLEAFVEPPEGGEIVNWTTQYLPLVCFEAVEDKTDIILALFPIGMIISIPFLLATFLVYAIIPELRNLHGKALMCYVSGLMMAYGFLAFIQINNREGSGNTLSHGSCLFIAFTIYFFFMVSFFWLNVMCFDIWWTFSGFRAPRQGRRVAERRRFLLYCLYAWGLPLVLTGVCALMQFHEGIPKHHVRPEFGVEKCWFREWKGELVYFYMPVIILVVINLALFASTSCKILQINRETAMLKTGDSSRHDQYSKDKQRYNLYLKLFLVMGINWVAEWISWILGGSRYFWILTDLSNTMLGVFIFIIFVWKKKIKNLLLKRYYLLRYGTTTTKGERTSSRFRSANIASTSVNDTERSFLSQDESAIRLSQLK